ncbi:MAG: hypothetical protein ACK4LQ_08785 [Pararhodobacter sp.]
MDGGHTPAFITDYVAGEDRVTLALYVHYTDTDPAITTATDEAANEVRISVGSEVVAVLAGTTIFDPADLDVVVLGVHVPDGVY